MSKKRLHKSTDVVISGVCGGIAEYFDIDPTLVRILTVVLVIVGMGVPILVYVICMIAIPPDPGVAQGYVDARAECTKPPCNKSYANVASDAAYSEGTSSQTPPDSASRVSATGGTASVGGAGSTRSSFVYSSSTTVDAGTTNGKSGNKTKNLWPAAAWFGAVLIGIGVIALLCNLVHFSLWRCWPVVLIFAGAVSLFTPGTHGWSLERAGNSIVLITVGLALLAWMLQIIPFRVFVEAFSVLWPALLVVLGLTIIGSAQKSSMIKLLSSLLLAATIILGLWFYGGLDWSSFNNTVLLMDTEGINDLMEDLRNIP